MNTTSKFLKSVLIITLLLIFGATVNLTLLADEVAETLRGTVTAADWDEENNVIAVAISVATVVENENEEEETVYDDYLVVDNQKGRELLQLVGEEVEVKGKVTTDDEGSMTIEVTAFKVISED